MIIADISQEPRLWFGIGILYDRYGSLEHAEEAFSAVMHMAPDFAKGTEIYFRLGIIYKQQHKYEASLEVCHTIFYAQLLLTMVVLSIHRKQPSSPPYGGRHLVPNWTRLRAVERCKYFDVLACLTS